MKKENHLAHFLDGNLSETEIAEMKKSPDFDLYEKIKLFTEALETPLDEKPEMLHTIVSAEKIAPKVISFRQTMIWVSAAASIVLLLGVGYWLTFAQSAQFRTGYAQFQNITLPDGSLVTLNSDASLNFRKFSWEHNRNLNLEGEAWFRVAKGEKFSVYTPTGIVSVLGTQFNVKSRDGKMEVACFEGKVSVDQLGKNVILTKGESLVIANGEWIESQVSEAEPNWMNRKISFNSASLHEMTAELQRVYNIRIDSKLHIEQTFTGVLPADNLETALQIVESAFKVKRVETEKGKYTLKMQ
ncbi:FecR family protein [Flavobacterium sp.]|uniref:FecR family protein n=1 Tax=Flavobacterium sp. TaxID=239 RepID=UPI0011F9DA44|nr:FecR domain-containing protein [Flavobacterium sp.]RZJ71471.1 MAG: DUF4974 domain-containing protein [Flavobacterium sp.]